MDPQQVRERLQEFKRLCRLNGVALTVQRCAVLEAALERGDHPTADQVWEIVSQRVPGISRTTVYRVLDMLVEMGIIRRLHHPGPVARFDGKVRRHHHLICKKCNKVIDLDSERLDRLCLPDVEAGGFQIDDFSVQFIGTCASCRQRETR